MPGRGSNWKSKAEKRAPKKSLQDFNDSAKQVLMFGLGKKLDDPFSIPRKGRSLEEIVCNSHRINKKKINRQNRDYYWAGWGMLRPKEKYLKAWLNEIDAIPEDEACDYEETAPLRKPLPRTLESFMPEDQHERRQPDDDDTKLRLAIAMSIQENQKNQETTENQDFQEALLLSIRDATTASRRQDVGGSEHSALTATWQGVAEGSELSVPVSVRSWVDVPPEVSAIDPQNVDGSRNVSPEPSKVGH